MHVAQNTLYIDKYGEHTYKVTNYENLASLLIIWVSHQSETNLPVCEVLNTDMLTILLLHHEDGSNLGIMHIPQPLCLQPYQLNTLRMYYHSLEKSTHGWSTLQVCQRGGWAHFQVFLH